VKAAPTIILSGGGTGGHLFPAIAIAEQIRKEYEQSRIIFVGSEKHIEHEVVPKYNYVFHPITIQGLARKLTLKNLKLPFVLLSAIRRCKKIMRDEQPDIVIGTGGYVSLPVMLAAAKYAPTMIHEQNEYPGLTTKVLQNKATEVHISFDETRKHLRRKSGVFTSGNPIRSTLKLTNRNEAKRKLGFDESKKLLFAFGGSLGAKSINDALLNNSEKLATNDIQILWQTGKANHSAIADLFKDNASVQTKAFVDDMGLAYSAADLVVCRAGATSLAELTTLGIASVLVPYPYAAHDHQKRNAQMMAGNDCSEMILDNEVQDQMAMMVVELIHNDERLEIMRQNTKRIAKPHAAETIVRAVSEILKN
jgi:UDP-N-acetylglucosamine--N-acetylmuramyl-(pentapeptide) pyrophosphoryl-undecaprenol N-acetylglucosamine transferase